MTQSESPSGTGPWRRAIPPGAHESLWHAADGAAIRRFDWPAQASRRRRGTLLFLPGRGDIYEKYLESFSHWHACGWTIVSSDWRGQAGSGRLGPSQHIGHIDDFATWIADLARLWADIRATLPGPHVVIAHSMGGHLALRALAEHAINPAAAVLTDSIRLGPLVTSPNFRHPLLLAKDLIAIDDVWTLRFQRFRGVRKMPSPDCIQV